MAGTISSPTNETPSPFWDPLAARPGVFFRLLAPILAGKGVNDAELHERVPL
jgi:hypothetical protein